MPMNPEQQAKEDAKQTRVSELLLAFSAALHNVKTPVPDSWMNIIRTRDRALFQRCKFVGNSLLTSEVGSLAVCLYPGELPEVITGVTQAATTKLVLAVIANLVFSRHEMIADPKNVHYNKAEADNVEAFSHVLYSEEPEGKSWSGNA